jgi:hypothetical protein
MRTLNLKKLTVLFGLSLMIFITACQKDQNLDEIANEPQVETTDGSEYDDLFTEVDLLNEPVISDANEKDEFEILNDGLPQDVESPEAESNTEYRDSNGNTYSLWGCLDSLTLTRLQKKAIVGAVVDRNLCRKYHIIQIRKINHQIIAQANKERNFWMIKYLKGDITLNRLLTELVKIKVKTKYQLRNNPAKQHHIIALKKCNRTYVLKLKHILTPRQWVQYLNCRRGK